MSEENGVRDIVPVIAKPRRRRSSGASFNRHNSLQDVETPADLIAAVEARFGKITIDLAANKSNHKADVWLGPGGVEPDSLAVDWARWDGTLWLNPPYRNITAWAAKCAKTSTLARTIVMLIPASVGTNWWADYVHEKAMVHFLRPRVIFKGHTQPYPKDLAIVAYGPPAGYLCWRWRL